MTYNVSRLATATDSVFVSIRVTKILTTTGGLVVPENIFL